MTLPDQRQFTAKQYATIYTAVGWLRGALYDVLIGEIDKEHIKRLVSSTSLARLSQITKIEEDDLFIDNNAYLSEKEKHAIGGADWTEL